MSKKLIPAIFSLMLATLPLAAQDAEAAKSAVEAARKAAADAGVKVPEIKQEDLDKLLKKASEELSKSKNKETKEKLEKLVQDASTPNVRIEALPAWIPAIPGFTLLGPGRQWSGEKFDNGKMKGTSTAKPAELVTAWLAMDGKGYNAEHTTKSADKVVTEKVRLTKVDAPNVWAEFTAVPGSDGQPTQVRVVYSQPAAKDGAPPAAATNPATEIPAKPTE